MNSIAAVLDEAVHHHQSGRLEQAEVLYREIIRIDSRHSDALHLLGVAAHQRRNHSVAVEFISRAIAVNRTTALYHSNLGAALRDLGQLNRAIESFREAVRISPDFSGAHYNLGMALEAGQNFDEAKTCYHEAIRLDRSFANAWNNLGRVDTQMNDNTQAVVCYREVVRLKPESAEALYNLANALGALGKADEGVDCFLDAIKLDPHIPVIHNNLGLSLSDLGRDLEASDAFRNAIQLDPNFAEAYNNLGMALLRCEQIDAAISSLLTASTLLPQRADFQYNLACAFEASNRQDEAATRLELAIELRPDFVQAHSNLAVFSHNRSQMDAAVKHFERAMTLDPTTRRKLQCSMLSPPIATSNDDVLHWRRRATENIDRMLKENATIDPAVEILPPTFYFAYQGMNDRRLLESIDHICRSSHVPGKSRTESHHAKGDKIRIGFISNYFHDHTIGLLMQGLITKLSRRQFHVSVLSPRTHKGTVAENIRRHADDFVEISTQLPLARRRVDEQNIDILFYSDVGIDALTSTLARSRMADVQCTTWGHPSTTGIKTIDYFLSSNLIEPDNADTHYSEKLIQLNTLPTCYDRPDISSDLKPREHFGLCERSHLYICPQSLFKFHPDFDVFLSDILKRDPLGELVMIDGTHPHWNTLLLNRFRATFGNEISRVRFLPRQSRSDFLNLLALSDVMLDPLYFGGGNTTYQALALGLPIVTLPSSLMRGRVTLGCYRKMGITNCIVDSHSEYVERACRLANDRMLNTDTRQSILATNDVLFEDIQAVHEIEQFFMHAVANK